MAHSEMNKSKSPSSSEVIKTEVVCPNDTNPMGILQGGRMVQWMDIAAAVSAQTHAGKICVTASMDTVRFENPAYVGDVITVKAKITRTFISSMEIRVEAWSNNVAQPKKKLICEAYFTFVALDKKGKPTTVMAIKPVTSAELKLHAEANKRRKQDIRHKT